MTNLARALHNRYNTMQTDDFVALGDAVKAGDVPLAGELLARHPELAQKLNDPIPGGYFGAPAILSVVRSQNREMIDLLIRHGADINGRSDWWAGSFGVLDSCEPGFAPVLIERGAVVDAHAAARLGMLERLKELVTASPELVHSRGGDGKTPLHVASSVEIAKYLLDHGADMDARDVDHESTPAQYLVREHPDVARFLVTRGCHTDILMASALGAGELVRRHLDDDPESIRTRVSWDSFPMQDPRAGGTIYIWTLGFGKTAHVVAREVGHDDVFQLLMERTPDTLRLVHACLLGEDETIHALIASRPDLVRSLSDADRRAISEAASANDTAAVQRMLFVGWPVDVRGREGGAPLHSAAWLGNVEMVRDLLRHGAAVDDRGDKHHLSPLGWALDGSVNSWNKDSGDYSGTVKALLDSGAELPELSEDLEASAPVLDLLRHRARKLHSGGLP
jgi:ankyrin repeat protein